MPPRGSPSRKVYEEALIIAYGEGRNGKSTFWNTVSKVLGTYAGTISADTMTANCRRNVKPEIAELKGKRLAIAAELEEGMLLSTSVLKQVCSTDVVRGEKKFKDPFDYTPKAKYEALRDELVLQLPGMHLWRKDWDKSQ